MLTRYGEKQLTWVDLVSPSPAEVRSLMLEFDLHPAIAQELLAPSTKSKVERHDGSVYLILHFPALRGTNRPEQEIDFVLGKNFLITGRYEDYNPLHSFAKAFEVDTVLGRNDVREHGGHLFVAMMRALYRSLTLELDNVSTRLQEIEERIFKGNEREMVIELSLVGRTIHNFRTSLAPHEEMLNSLEPAAQRLFGPEFSYHLRSIFGEYERVVRTVEHLRAALEELRQTNNSLLSTKQNEIMKILTIMAFVTFPLTLITSIFGMNTEYLPIVGLPGDFWIILGFMALLALSFFIFFKRKKWL
jgi:magnesium transporter